MFGWTEGGVTAKAVGSLYNRVISEKIRLFLDFYFRTIFQFVIEKSEKK
jgi:hypothetical protein